jgi:hypothetical protein
VRRFDPVIPSCELFNFAKGCKTALRVAAPEIHFTRPTIEKGIANSFETCSFAAERTWAISVN